MESQLGSHYLAYAERMERSELGHLMAQYGDDVTRYAYAITRNRQRAEDIAQEVFIKAYRSVETFKGQSSIKTWLFSITRNMAINEMKSAYMRRIVLFEWVKPRSSGASAEEQYIAEQSVIELRSILLRLPVKLREVLLLSMEHELTMAEIAGLLQVSEGTVKSRLHRARKAVEAQWRERAQ